MNILTLKYYSLKFMCGFIHVSFFAGLVHSISFEALASKDLATPSLQSAPYGKSPTLSDAVPAHLEKRIRALWSVPDFNTQLARSVSFESAESSHADQISTINSVSLIQADGLDVWLMHQYRDLQTPQGLAQLALLSPEARAVIQKRPVFYVGIAVDTKAQPPVAYYLEFRDGFAGAGTGAGANKIPQLAPYSVTCFRCHPSGPRVLRPQAASHGAHSQDVAHDRGMAPVLRARLDSFNAKISNYGVVKTYFPSPSAQTRLGLLAPPEPGAFLPVKDRTCVGCHSVSSGVRNALLEPIRSVPNPHISGCRLVPNVASHKRLPIGARGRLGRLVKMRVAANDRAIGEIQGHEFRVDQP